VSLLSVGRVTQCCHCQLGQHHVTVSKDCGIVSLLSVGMVVQCRHYQ
jgi:hypothetical protein